METPANDESPLEHNGEHAPFLAHHFETPQQQFAAGKLGMWMFLVTEVLLFGGLFCAYAVYRAHHPEVFIYAAEEFLNKGLGALNTAVLIFSSFTMAWGVRCAQTNQTRQLIILLTITLACGLVFLGVKAVEYHHKWHEGLLWAGQYDRTEHGNGDASHNATTTEDHAAAKFRTEPKNVGVFFSIYFAMTGLHALHVIIGMTAILWVLIRAGKGHFSSEYFGPVDYVGLYWHLVDLIWIFLFPLLYLID